MTLDLTKGTPDPSSDFVTYHQCDPGRVPFSFHHCAFSLPKGGGGKEEFVPDQG